MGTLKDKAAARRAKRNEAVVENTQQQIEQQPEQQTPETPVPANPFSKMLEGLKTQAQQEKTDAAKMQKYYALTDALGSLGKMGGAAVGGAIGGNVWEGAPAVQPYKPNRGYIDAFEKAKDANKRINQLNDQQYQLALTLDERDYQRGKDAWAQGQREKEFQHTVQQAKDNKEWQAEQNELNRQHQEKMAYLNSQLSRAAAKENREETARIRKEMLEEQREYNLKLAEQEAQNGGNGQGIPIYFNNGQGIRVSNTDYEGLKRHFMDYDKVDEENIEQYLSDNPRLVNDYLRAFGQSFITAPQISQKPMDLVNQSMADKWGSYKGK